MILIVAQGSCFAVIWTRGLGRRYAALLAYLGFSLFRGLALAPFDRSTDGYADLWLWTLPVVIALQIAAAIEAYRNSLEELPGAQRASHLAILSGCLLAAAAAQWDQQTYTPDWILSRAAQAVAMVLGLAAVGIAGLISVLRPLRRRNAVIHERILTFHFGALALLMLLLNQGQDGWTATANVMVSIICCSAWALLLTPAGEQLPEAPPPAAHDHQAAHELTRLRTWLREALK